MQITRRLSRAGRLLPQFAAALFRWSVLRPSQARHVPRWMGSLQRARSGLRDERPWMNFDAIGWLDRTVQSTWNVFEFGSGGSTLFLARRASQVVSVEHHPQWHAQVHTALCDKRLLDRCTYRLVEPAPLPPGGSAGEFGSAAPGFTDRHFGAYVSVLDNYPDGSFDLVVVDGRARVACARRAVPKVRPGGYLVLDNAQRDRYRPVFDMLGEPCFRATGCTPYQLIPATTAAWRINDPSLVRSVASSPPAAAPAVS